MKEKDSSPLQGREKKRLIRKESSLSQPKKTIVKSTMHWRNPRYFSLPIPTCVFENEIRENIRVAILSNGDELTIRLLPRGESK